MERGEKDEKKKEKEKRIEGHKPGSCKLAVLVQMVILVLWESFYSSSLTQDIPFTYNLKYLAINPSRNRGAARGLLQDAQTITS